MNFCPSMAFGDGAPVRALATAVAVGTLLIVIDHGDTILAGSIPPLAKFLSTYCVPYAATTWGAIIEKRAQWRIDQNE